MFDKLKYLLSFNWFYIALFLVLGIFTFWDELTVGNETLKIIIENKREFNQKSMATDVKDNKIGFIDLDKICDDEVSVYNGEIEYVFFHPLISDKCRNANLKAKEKRLLNSLFLTSTEFKKVLNKLYENNYIIVDIFDVYTQTYKDGKFKVQRKDLKIPKGKKPLILFVDDLSYNHMFEGFTCSKLIVDPIDSKVKSLIEINADKVISEEDEVIPILNKFIEENPDFSLNGARGVISLTGYEGVFGYNTGKNARRTGKNTETLRRISKDIFDAKMVADKLKQDGWRFSCHTYAHINLKNATIECIKEDLDNWFKCVSNIIGSTNIFVSPYDNFIDENDERFKYLQSNGFNIFCFSGKGSNKDLFTLKDYVFVYRNLISYDTIKSGKKEIHNLFKDKRGE